MKEGLLEVCVHFKALLNFVMFSMILQCAPDEEVDDDEEEDLS